MYLAEAIILAISKLGAYALIPLSLEFVEAGVPELSYFQTLGDFFYTGIYRQGYDIHTLFFCIGGILWYYLLYRSRNIPRVLSIWGLVSVCLVSINNMFALFNPDIGLIYIMVIPYIPFELVIGVWLIIKGINVQHGDNHAPKAV